MVGTREHLTWTLGAYYRAVVVVRVYRDLYVNVWEHHLGVGMYKTCGCSEDSVTGDLYMHVMSPPVILCSEDMGHLASSAPHI